MNAKQEEAGFNANYYAWLNRCSEEELFDLVNACKDALSDIIAQGFTEVNEGFDPEAGTKPIILIRERLLSIFSDRLKSSYSPGELKVNEAKIIFHFFKSDNPVDMAIRALQDKVLLIGNEASMKVYIAFSNILEKAMQGGVTAKEPLFIDAGRVANALFVIFAGMVCFPEFKKSVASFGHVDQLHILDPHRSWYMQDPEGNWNGYAYYGKVLDEQISIRKSEKNYRRVCFLGNSMGASAACLFSPMADAVLAFCPQTELVREDIPAKVVETYRRLLLENMQKAVSAGVRISIHRGNKATDVDQCSRLPSNIHLVVHRDCAEHNLPGYLKSRGELLNVLGSVL